jgi:GNAT superfamily N-acetyltransferase
VQVDGHVEGSIAIDGQYAAEEGAHLRWFIVSDALGGQGAGNRLLDAAMEFCRNKSFSKTFLWTFDGLFPARHLYEKASFVPVEQRSGAQWGIEVKEQRFECFETQGL